MRKPIYFFVVLGLLIIATTFVASAISFEGDASYMYGVGDAKGRGFVAHARAEVMDQIFVDGSFLSTNAAKSAEGDASEGSTLRNSLISVGGLYRPVNDSDLEVFVGAGFLRLIVHETGLDDVSGQGIYGKFGFKFLPMPQLSIVADVSYAPKYKEKGTDNASGNLISARATASYEVMDGLAVQGTVKHYRASVAPQTSDILLGGGVTFHF